MIKVFYGKVEELLDETLFNAYIEYVGERVSSKISKINNIDSKCRTLGGWVLLKYALSELNSIDLYDNIEYNKFGKPFIKSSEENKKEDFYFNISHSKEYFVCAVSNDEIGCDIEKMRGKMPKIYTKIFHKDELYYIDGFKNHQKIEKFIHLWSMKESFVKCLGIGFSKKTGETSLFNKNTDSLVYEIIYENEKIYINSVFINNYYISISSYTELWNKTINFIELKNNLT